MNIIDECYICTVMGNKKTCLEIYSCDTDNHVKLLYADSGIRAGFPSPAQDFMDLAIDLNTELITHPEATFYGRVVGNSLRDAGVDEGDILVIDKSIKPRNGDMAVCFIDGEFTLKFIRIGKEEILLQPANPEYPPIRVTEENSFLIWGIVTYTIKKRRK